MNERGVVLVYALLILGVIATGLLVGTRFSKLTSRKTEIAYAHDLKSLHASQFITRFLDKIGAGNRALIGLHHSYETCTSSTSAIPALRASCEVFRVAIMTLSTTLSAGLRGCSGHPVYSSLFIDISPWPSWWQKFTWEYHPKNGMPYRLSARSLNELSELQVRLVDPVSRNFNSNSTVSYCGSLCTHHRWRFGG